MRRVLRGESILNKELIVRVLRHLADQTSSQEEFPPEQLSPREREVLELMAEGHSNSALAQQLSITERAVEKHVSAIFSKLDLPPSQAHHRRVLAVVTYLNS